MKTERIFWGIILVFVGLIFLLENFDIINFSWASVWRFWPILLIVTGVNLLFSRINNKTGSITIGIITIICLGVITYKGIENNSDNENRWGEEDYPENSFNTSSYTEDYEEKFKHAKLAITGGASHFHISSETDKLFEANLQETRHNYILKKTEYDSLVNLSFNGKGAKDFKFEKEGLGNVKIMLNKKPVWDLDLEMGAGEADFDLEDFNVKRVDLKGGAAEFNLKLGDLVDVAHVNVETGLASVNIQIPENVGCVIKNSSGLSSKYFEGFKETGRGNYETPNFHVSQKKIYIVLKGGLSDLQVKRYN